MSPSPSLGPPLLSESWSPPLFWGMPLFGGAGLATGGAGFGRLWAGWGFAAGGAGGCGRMLRRAAAGRGWLEIWFPAGDTANQAAPNAIRPWPVMSPGFVSLTNEVQRVAVVGDLPGAARTGDGSELGGGQSLAGDRHAGCQQRRPRGRARACARALGAESALNRYRVRPVRVDQDRSEAALATRTVAVFVGVGVAWSRAGRRRRRGRGGGGRHRRRPRRPRRQAVSPLRWRGR